MIAMALICGPKLLIADEPTTALDVTIQAQISTSCDRCRTTSACPSCSSPMISASSPSCATTVVVMYAGRVAEQGPVAEVLGHPRHPYTAGLLAASPRHARRGMPLAAIPGLVPAPAERGAGCSFFGRCPRHLDRCATITPPLVPFADGRAAACWNPLT